MFKRIIGTAVLLLATAGTASAQKWDAPLFFSPRPMDDIGLYYTNTDAVDNSHGLRLIWRQSGNLNLGVHAGTGDIENIGESIIVGAELYGSLDRLFASGNLLTAWSLGLGAAFGDVEGVDYIDFSVPVGISIGVPIGTGSTTILPFIHPRVSLDVVSVTVDGDEETETDIGLAADLGAEIALGQSLLLRAAYTFGNDNDAGERKAFGIGLALRMQRKVIAR